jgi:protein involved in polysaccharide export with SLBB domain
MTLPPLLPAEPARNSRRRDLGRVAQLVLFVALLALTSCSSVEPNPLNRVVLEEERQGAADSEFPGDTGYSSKLYPGDLITITFSDVDRPPPTQSVNIPEAGVINLPFNVHVQAAGKTVNQLEKDVRDSYVPATYVTLTVSIKVERRAFFVDGEVKQPGRQEYAGKITVLRAISTAGGFTDFANRKKIEVRRTGGQKFVVNWHQALKDPTKDVAVFPNDYIIVMRRVGIW